MALHRRIGKAPLFLAGLCLAAVALFQAAPLRAQAQKTTWNEQEKPIAKQIDGLRDLPDDVRALTTKELALEIRSLPAAANKLRLAYGLANLSTEGDFGRDTLQEVATTLAGALREHPAPRDHGQPAAPYIELAQLAHYEHVQASLDDPQFAAAMSKIATDDAFRQRANFTLTDLQGKRWTLRELRGKVVLVNFWATWCPPCRKEMPDLETLHNRFKDQGLVILGISDEQASKVEQLVAKQKVTYTIMLDPGGKVNKLFRVQGIPKSFIYDRGGNLVAESIDMRTQRQFLEMLGQAGLH